MLPLATEVTVLTVELLEVEQVELTAEQQGRVRDMLTEGDVSVEVVEAMLDDILTEGGTVDAAALHNDTLLQLVRAPSDLCVRSFRTSAVASVYTPAWVRVRVGLGYPNPTLTLTLALRLGQFRA